MRDPVPSPLDFDPDFSPLPPDSKGGSKVPSGDEAARLDLLPTEAALRVAGTVGMVLAATTFVVFAVPVSAMLEDAGKPGGILDNPDWIIRRWIARMAVVLTLAVVAAATSRGLARRRPWSWWALIALASTAPAAWIVGIAARSGAATGGGWELGEVMTFACVGVVGVVVFAASFEVFRVAWSWRVRKVLAPGHEDLVARTPKLSPTFRTAVPAGLGLAAAMLVLYWTLMVLILGVLVVAGVIQST